MQTQTRAPRDPQTNGKRPAAQTIATTVATTRDLAPATTASASAANLAVNLAVDIEALTQQLGQQLLAALRRNQHTGLADALYEQMLKLATHDDRLKIELFRFVDVLPSLQTSNMVSQHLVEYLDQPNVTLPAGMGALMALARKLPGGHGLMSRAAHWGARLMSERFIAGSNLAETTRAVERLRQRNMAFTLDLLGEAVISEREAEVYQRKYLDMLRGLGQWAAQLPTPSLAPSLMDTAPDPATGTTLAVPRVNVSVKLSSLYARFDPMAAEATAEAVKARLRPILSLAQQTGAQVHIDMEQYDYRDATVGIFKDILMEPEYRDWPHIGIVVQAYLKDSEQDLRGLLAFAQQRGTPFTIRLVKGAYWDYETMLAAQRDYPAPVFAHKWETDANYERLSEILIRNAAWLRPAIASHNVRSVAHAQALAHSLNLPARAIEYQVLFGMGESIGRALASQGERVRVYVPFGETLPGMAYLVRRLLENTSNDSFIRQVALDDTAQAQLLMRPESLKSATENPNGLVPKSNRHTFSNEPVIDFAIADNRQRMADALERVRGVIHGEPGFIVPLVIGGKQEQSPNLVARENPSNTVEVVSRAYFATLEQADRALDLATRTFPIWRDVDVAARAAVLRRVADYFRRNRFEIDAWQVYEAGKPWRDADGDVAEAIDFCEFYADEMERLRAPRKRNVPGEWNEYFYDARGPAVIIAPWNFPLAILTGMTVAALVAGNTVVIKPSEQTTRVAYFLMQALEAAGVPPGVAAFLPGEGESVGAALVADPRTAVIAFTGSRAVGLHILKEAADVKPGQREIKKVVAELGGKNAIIVDEDADLDEAVSGTVQSMIGYSGQKCSAASRVIVIGSAYETFCRRLKEALESIWIGDANDPATTLGPLIDADSQARIDKYIALGKQEGRLLALHSPTAEQRARGWFVPAAAFVDVPPEGRVCQEEIFGPVLAVLRAASLDEALQIADGTLYALTGGFYSRSPANIARVRREFRVGNLYINRKITGALVDRQPFGGGRMSGVGSKAGGPDYLHHFLLPRATTELVMRRGFAPVEDSAGGAGAGEGI